MVFPAARYASILVLPLALVLAACGADNDETEPEFAATQVAPDQGQRHPDDPRGAPGPEDRPDDGITHYSCEGGWTVEVTGDLARVSGLDGRVVELPVTTRSPPLYAGEAMEFSVDAGGATLGRDGAPLPCERE